MCSRMLSLSVQQYRKSSSALAEAMPVLNLLNPTGQLAHTSNTDLCLPGVAEPTCEYFLGVTCDQWPGACTSSRAMHVQLMISCGRE